MKVGLKKQTNKQTKQKQLKIKTPEVFVFSISVGKLRSLPSKRYQPRMCNRRLNRWLVAGHYQKLLVHFNKIVFLQSVTILSVDDYRVATIVDKTFNKTHFSFFLFFFFS